MLNDSITYLWTMIAGWVTAVATLGLVIGAALAWCTARKTLEQMERDSEATSRPYLVAEVVPSLGGPPSWDLVVRNVGQSAATNVRGAFSPAPSNPQDGTVSAVLSILAEGRTIAPGSVLRLYWRLGVKPGAVKDEGHDGFMEDSTLRLEYMGVSEKAYSDDFPLRPASMTPLPEEGPTRAGSDREAFAERQRAALIRAVNSLRAPW